MVRDNITLRRFDHNLVRCMGKPRRIKTKPRSHWNIKACWHRFVDAFNEYRIGRISEKLDKMENAVLSENFETDSASRLSEKAKKKLERKTAAIARLEEKKLILSKEKVPKNFVSRRAIKLNKRMMDNFTYNSYNAYSVGIDKKEEIFGADLSDKLNFEESNNVTADVTPVEGGDERVQEEPNDSVENIIADNGDKSVTTNEIDVTSPMLGGESAKEKVDEEFEKTLNSKIAVNISPEEVQKVVNGSSNAVSVAPVERKDISESVNQAFNGLVNKNDNSQGENTSSPVSEEVTNDSIVENEGLNNEGTSKNGNFIWLENDNAIENNDSVVAENNNESPISREDISESVNQAFNDLVNQNDNQQGEITSSLDSENVTNDSIVEVESEGLNNERTSENDNAIENNDSVVTENNSGVPTISRDDVVADLEEAFNNLNIQNDNLVGVENDNDSIVAENNGEDSISRDDMDKVVSEKFKDLDVQNNQQNGNLQEETASSESDVADRGETTVEDSDSDVIENRNSDSDADFVLDVNRLALVIQEALEKAFENYRVSQNGNRAAKVDKYGENGQEKKRVPNPGRDYKPLTDEEIEEAQKRIQGKKANPGRDYKPWTDEEIEKAREHIKDKNEFNFPAIKFDVPNLTDVLIPADKNLNAGNASSDATENEDSNKDVQVSNIPAKRFEVPNLADVLIPADKNLNAGSVSSDATENEDSNEDVQVRDFPTIVPDRDDEQGVKEYTMDTENQEEDKDNLHFDYSEATFRDLEDAVDSVNTLSEVEALKKRARELQEKQRETKEQMEAAQREAEAAAKKAAEAKEAARRSFEEYQKRVEKLRMYTEAVQEDCEFNLNKMEMARKAAEGDQRFAEEQNRKAQESAQLSEEIDAIIGPEAVNVRRR